MVYNSPLPHEKIVLDYYKSTTQLIISTINLQHSKQQTTDNQPHNPYFTFFTPKKASIYMFLKNDL